MSAQNLLFSNLPVSSLGLYDSTTQTIQTINSDSSGNINLNATGSVNATNINATTSVSSFNLSATNNITSPNMTLAGTLNAANIINSNSFQGGTGSFSNSCTANVLAFPNLTSSTVPAKGTNGQIFLADGALYFYNPTNNSYYTINTTFSS
jgi:hypothetical protein